MLFYMHRIYLQNKHAQDELHSRASIIIDDAHNQSNQILKTAVAKSEETIRQTNLLRDDLIKKLEDAISAAAQKDVDALSAKSHEIDSFYKSLLNTIRQEHLKKTQEITAAVDQIANKEFADFSEVLKRETVQSEDLVLKKADEAFVKAQVDIENYRQQKFQEINNAVNKVVLEVSEEVIGKTLSLTEHQKLITESLDSAVKEGLLSSRIHHA